MPRLSRTQRGYVTVYGHPIIEITPANPFGGICPSVLMKMNGASQGTMRFRGTLGNKKITRLDLLIETN